MKSYKTRTTRLTILPAGEPIFSEMATHVEIEDQAAGEYVQITQQSGSTDVKEQSIAITPYEWPHLRQAVETMMGSIQSWENTKSSRAANDLQK